MAEKCRLLHVKAICEIPSCDVNVCKLRHPRVCKYFRDYSRCKFSDWCSYKHLKKSSDQVTIKEILDKLENLAKINREKDIIINNLAEK